MTKQEQIGEMAKIYCKNEFLCGKNCQTVGCYVHEICETLYNAGYRKIPENAVILTPEERDEEMKAYNEERAEFENEIYALKEENANLTVENEVLTRDKYNLERTLEEGVEELQSAKYEAVKEFAEKVKMAFFYEFDEIIPSIMSDKIDELLKEYEK